MHVLLMAGRDQLMDRVKTVLEYTLARMEIRQHIQPPLHWEFALEVVNKVALCWRGRSRGVGRTCVVGWADNQ